MPELPEVQTVINGLVNAVSGSKIISVECNYPGTVIIHSDVDKDALPARIKSFERRGKYILIHLENEHSLVVHLRMTGKLVFQSESNKEIHKHQRACFLLDHDQKLVFIDPRTFGKIILCRTDTLKNPSLSSVAKLGPEPLEQTFDFEYLKHKLSGRSLPIKNLLLDQEIVAGLGNIYVCEILYRAGVRPERPANDIEDTKVRSIIRHTKAVLQEAIAMNGTSISDFRRIDDKTGEFQNYLRVYQKPQCPLGHEVKRIKQSGRSSFYCPICQKK